MRIVLLTVFVIVLAVGAVAMVFRPLIVRYIGILKARDAADEQEEAERIRDHALRAQAEKELDQAVGVERRQNQGMK